MLIPLLRFCGDFEEAIYMKVFNVKAEVILRNKDYAPDE